MKKIVIMIIVFSSIYLTSCDIITTALEYNSIVSNISYNGNGNSSGEVPVDTGEYKIGSKVEVKGNSLNLEKIGYTFGGWNSEADGSGKNYNAGEVFTIPESDTVLYAKWSVIPLLDVLFVVDITGSISAALNAMKGEVDGAITEILNKETNTKFSLITFYNDVIEIKTDFTDSSNFKTAFNTLVASGINGIYLDAINLGMNNLTWRANCRQLIILITDSYQVGNSIPSGILVDNLTSLNILVYGIVVTGDPNINNEVRNLCIPVGGLVFVQETPVFFAPISDIMDDFYK